MLNNMRLRLTSFGLTTILSLTLLCPSLVYAAPSRTAVDVSWPNCKLLKKLVSAEPPIIGVNGGLDFHANHCLLSEVSLAHNDYSLYLNTGYPGRVSTRHFYNYPDQCDATDYLCQAYNYGYNAAAYSISYAFGQLAHSNVWWLDVETANSWTNSVLQNRAELLGMIAALKKLTVLPVIGFYSYPGQWNLITGHWHNKYPSWSATGLTTASAARQYCRIGNFTSGSVWLSQYTTNLDYDLLCNNNYPSALGF